MASPSLLDDKAVMTDRRASFTPPLEPHQLAAAIGVIVRVVPSHIMAPSDSPATAVEDITWLATGCWPPRR